MSRPDMAMRRVRALGARTHHVPGYGMIVMDDGSADEEKRLPKMPVDVIDTLVGWGWIADDVPHPLDHDGNGKKGGAKKPAKPIPAPAADAGEGQAPA